VSITSDGNSISCYNNAVQLYANGALSYRWQPAQYCNNDKIPSPSVNPPVTTVFTVTGTDAAGCTGTDTITVFAYKDVAVYIPNAFTPNGDGLNDDIKPMIFCDFVFEQFLVFDRWGENVFTSYRLDKGWDGTYKGSPAPLGVYHYFVKGRKSDGSPAMLKGNFTLIR
jgi:gliding motility-associated-like protein